MTPSNQRKHAMSYLDTVAAAQRAVLLRPMNWRDAAAKLQRNLAAAPPKYRPGIATMLRIARAP
jgi:hypothetical protein